MSREKHNRKVAFGNVPDPNAAMRNFERGLRDVLSVSKESLKQAMAKRKASREGKPKRGPKPKRVADHAVSTSV